jgi:hypothetical protein
MARRERLLSAKITKLAGSPCSYEPVSVPFSISNNNAGVSSVFANNRLSINHLPDIIFGLDVQQPKCRTCWLNYARACLCA